MKVNVYNEELTERVEFRTKTAGTGVKFYGISFYLASPKELHSTPSDDDSSAVTFWGDSPETLHGLLSRALREIEKLK
jgi:hypothetical protein